MDVSKRSKGVSERNRKMWKNPAYRKHMTEHFIKRNRERWADPQTHKRQAAIVADNGRRYLKTKLHSERMKHLFKIPHHRKRILKNLKRSAPSMSLNHRKLLYQLKRAKIRGLRFEYPVGRFRLDIAHLPTKTDIEVGGIYWHSRPGARERDKRRSLYLMSRGWTVYRVYKVTDSVIETFKEVCNG